MVNKVRLMLVALALAGVVLVLSTSVQADDAFVLIDPGIEIQYGLLTDNTGDVLAPDLKIVAYHTNAELRQVQTATYYSQTENGILYLDPSGPALSGFMWSEDSVEIASRYFRDN